MKVQPTLNTET